MDPSPRGLQLQHHTGAKIVLLIRAQIAGGSQKGNTNPFWEVNGVLNAQRTTSQLKSHDFGLNEECGQLTGIFLCSCQSPSFSWVRYKEWLPALRKPRGLGHEWESLSEIEGPRGGVRRLLLRDTLPRRHCRLRQPIRAQIILVQSSAHVVDPERLHAK